MRKLGISQKLLMKEIEKQFPRVSKPEEYTNLILEGMRLGAVDKIHAVKRKIFLESGVISVSIFQSSYSIRITR